MTMNKTIAKQNKPPSVDRLRIKPLAVAACNRPPGLPPARAQMRLISGPRRNSERTSAYSAEISATATPEDATLSPLRG